MILKKLIEKSLKIRIFENNLLNLFKLGEISGTVHTCVGQEYTGVFLSHFSKKGDMVFSNHRGHGHYLSFTNDYKGLLNELLGKKNGCSRGFGGTQHLINDNFISNGIQGGMVPIAAGFGLDIKNSKKDNICYAFIGDGTLGEGILWESINIISKWNLPVIIILEDNNIAQSTSKEQTFSGNLKDRINGFGLNYYSTSTDNLEDFFDSCKIATENTRNSKPSFLHIKTNRLNSHSKGDDNRPEDKIKELILKDPINRLKNDTTWNYKEALCESQKFINELTEECIQEKSSDYTDIKYLEEELCISNELTTESVKPEHNSKRINELIGDALDSILKLNKNSILIGEDIEDGNKFLPNDYGGAFKVTKTLSKKYPFRVKNTPISEGAICGISLGVALAGKVGICEIMFGDFTTLIFDQLLQHASKIHLMYGKKIDLQLIIRTPMGGYRGYGPTHSQSLEKHFIGIPGLEVVVLNNFDIPKELYDIIIRNKKPCLIIENKTLYTRKLYQDLPSGFGLEKIITSKYPIYKISNGNKPDVTIVTYGGLTDILNKAITNVFINDEVNVECFILSCITDFPIKSIVKSTKLSERIIVVEEGSTIGSIAGEISLRIKEEDSSLNFKMKRIGNNTIIPSSKKLEELILPSVKNIEKAIIELI
jgi:2-oxoisovalerate dehydrogenase E1 component